MNVMQLDEETIYHVARSIGAPEARAAYLQEVCGDNTALRDRLEALLHVCEQEASFLEFSPHDASVDMPDPIERPGTIIGPYKLREQIGEGGMGVVYVAEQSHPVRRKVALKVIKPGMDTKQVVARFEAERQALAMMDHPNIAKVHDGGTTESGRPYFVMELVPGVPITEYCDGERLSVRQRLELFVLVCRAVQHAHQKGIIHRDLKPSNILVTLHDGVPVPKVIDFGVAKAMGQSLTEKTVYTALSQLVGTPLYMSPEQAEMNQLGVDTRSDVYSLGVLLYELLTGTTPFDKEALGGSGLEEMRRMIREDEPPRPARRVSTLQPEALSTTSQRRSTDPRRISAIAPRRAGLDRDEVAGEGPQPALRVGQRVRHRRDALPDRPAGRGVPAVGRVSLHEVRPPEPGGPDRRRPWSGLALVAGTVVATWQAIRATRAVTLASQREREAQSSAARATQARTLASQREREAQSAAAESKAAAAESKAVLTFLVQDMLGARIRSGDRDGMSRLPRFWVTPRRRSTRRSRTSPWWRRACATRLGPPATALGQFDLAERHLSRSYELRRDLLGPRTCGHVASMTNLAQVLAGKVRMTRAASCLSRLWRSDAAS